MFRMAIAVEVIFDMVQVYTFDSYLTNWTIMLSNNNIIEKHKSFPLKQYPEIMNPYINFMANSWYMAQYE